MHQRLLGWVVLPCLAHAFSCLLKLAQMLTHGFVIVDAGLARHFSSSYGHVVQVLVHIAVAAAPIDAIC